MVLSVIIGEETEVVGVRACLTWKPLSVLTLMGRMKRGCVKALSLPPAPPGLQHSPGLEHSRIAKWGPLHPPLQNPPSRPLHPGAAVSHQVPPNPPSLPLSLAPQTTTTTTATTPSHPSPSPPTVQSGPALLHLTSLAGAEQRPTRHQDNETGV